MFDVLKQNRFLKFLIISSLSYISLYIVYEFVIKKYTFWDQAFIRVIINSADTLLNGLGYHTFKKLSDTDFQVIGVDGSNGVWVGASCNALTLFFLFIVFIAAYPGHQKSKWWYILTGLLSIHILNIFRVVALALIAFYKPEYLDFNHTYTFTFAIYCYIFLLWIIWVNKYSIKENHGEK